MPFSALRQNDPSLSELNPKVIPPQRACSGRGRAFLSASLVFLFVLGVTAVTFGLLFDADNNLVDARFNNVAHNLIDSVERQIADSERTVTLVSRALSALVMVGGVSRVPMHEILAEAANEEYINVINYYTYVRGVEDFATVYDDYNLSNPFVNDTNDARPTVLPVLALQNGKRVVSLNISDFYAFTSYRSDVPPNATVDTIRAYAIFTDYSPLEGRRKAFDEAIKTDKVVSVAPVFFPFTKTFGTTLYKAVYSRPSDNGPHGYEDVTGFVAAPLRNDFGETVRVGEGGLGEDSTWWALVDVDADEFLYQSTETSEYNAPPNSTEEARAQSVKSREIHAFSRHYVMYVGRDPKEFADEAASGTQLIVLAAGITLACVLAPIYYCSSLAVARGERFRLDTMRAQKQHVEGEVETYERVLGYVNHEIRNPLNVLVASLEFIEETVRDYISPHCSSASSFRSTGSRSSDETEEGKDQTTVLTDAEGGVGAGAGGGGKESEGKDSLSDVIAMPSAPALSSVEVSEEPKSGESDGRKTNESEEMIHLPGEVRKQLVSDVAAMREASSQLERQVNDMLDFQQLKRGMLHIQPTVVDVSGVLLRLRHEHAVIAAVPIHTTIRDGHRDVCEDASRLSLQVVVDELRLRQLIINGLTNAIKFTDQGHITITASVTLDSEQEDQEETSHQEEIDYLQDFEKHPAATLHVEMRDTGVGLGTLSDENLFQPFVKYGSNRKREMTRSPDQEGGKRRSQDGRSKNRTSMRSIPSSGLGLPICKLLIQRLKGRVDIRDAPDGPGCIFSFSIPVRYVGSSPVASKSDPTPPQPEPLLMPSLTPPAEEGEVKEVEPVESSRTSLLMPPPPPPPPSSTQRSGGDVAAAQASSSSHPSSSSTPKLRVLIVDDVPSNVRIASRILSRCGCDCRGIDSAPFYDAIASELRESGQIKSSVRNGMTRTYDLRTYDLILLDIRLKDEYGVSILQSLQPMFTSSPPHVIAMTASATAEDVALYRSKGFHGCLPKPISLKSCREMLECLKSSSKYWPSVLS